MKRGLNVGSGQRPFSTTDEIEWCNVDKVAHEGMPEPDMVCDGSRLPFPNDSEDYVVLHHVVEHFGCGESAGLIREAHRVLKPAGSLIVTVPNMRELSVGWLTGKISTQIYLTNVYGAYMGHEEDRHRWGFDQESLLRFLALNPDVPWRSVGLFNFRTISGADIARDWWILGVECLK